MQPLFSSPALIINMQAMVKGAGLEKAPVRSSVLRMGKPNIPGKRIMPRENMATMSGGIHSLMKAVPARIRTMKTSAMSQCWLMLLTRVSTILFYWKKLFWLILGFC